MAVKHVEIRTCDRCESEIERRSPLRLEIGWFKLVNGSGSRYTGSGRGDLDKDLCERCTTRFFDWWEDGGEA